MYCAVMSIYRATNSLGAGKSATVRDISGPAFKGLVIEVCT